MIADVPRLTDGLELLGRYKGSGYGEPVYLARRADGQMIQLSALLFLTAREIDGRRDADAIAVRVGCAFGQEVSAQNIRYIVEHKLQPLGVAAVPGGDTAVGADAPRSDLLLGLMGRRTLFPPRWVQAASRSLAWLHHPAVVAVVLMAATAMDSWLFFVHGAVEGLLAALDQPLLLLAVFGLTVASLVFHEFGHASACRYSGATPGRIGCGLYLLWPSLYTDVTDVYRINRIGRLRTDLGGVYFNVVFMLLLAALYASTGWSFLLAAVYLGHFEIFEQLVPMARLDGYYILADVAGVPDLYGQILPILTRLLPTGNGRRARKPALELTRSARITVTVWVLVVVPLVLTDLGYSLWNLPRISATAMRSLSAQIAAAHQAATAGDFGSCALACIGLALLVLPLVGIACLLARLLQRLARLAVTTTTGHRVLRTALSATALAAVLATAGGWLTGNVPEPLPPRHAPLSGHGPTASPTPVPPGPVPRRRATPRGLHAPHGNPGAHGTGTPLPRTPAHESPSAAPSATRPPPARGARPTPRRTAPAPHPGSRTPPGSTHRQEPH